MTIYTLLAVKGDNVEEFVQHTNLDLMVDSLEDTLQDFGHRLKYAAALGPGHYGLGYTGSGAHVQLLVVEYNTSGWLFPIICAILIGAGLLLGKLIYG